MRCWPPRASRNRNGGRRRDSPDEIAALLRWLADGHFTFLGYREYDLADGPDGMALRAVPGTGLGILRHDKQGSSAVRRAAARRSGPGPVTRSG